MKSSFVKKILLPLVIIVWTIVAVQIYFYLVKSDEPKYTKRAFKPEDSVLTRNPDSIVLLLNYRDPFLDNEMSFSKHDVIENYKKTKFHKTNPKVVTTIWPNLTFTGTVKNISKNIWIAQLNIEGKSIGVKTGDKFNEITVLSISNDSILLSFKNESKIFKLHNQ